MRTQRLCIAFLSLSTLVGACDADPDERDNYEVDAPEIRNLFIDGERASVSDLSQEEREELNLALIEEAADESGIRHRAGTCTVDCGGGTNMTCSGTAACAALTSACIGCDEQEDGDGVDCWEFTCGANIAPSGPSASGPQG